jgi:hypothetical protein
LDGHPRSMLSGRCRPPATWHTPSLNTPLPSLHQRARPGPHYILFSPSSPLVQSGWHRSSPPILLTSSPQPQVHRRPSPSSATPIELFPTPKTATHRRISTKTPPFSFSLVSTTSTQTPCDLSHPSLSSSSCEAVGTSEASHRPPEPLPTDHLRRRIVPWSLTPLR